MGMGRVWQSKFKLEKTLFFGKRDFDLWGKLTPKNACPLCCPPMFSIFSRSGSLESSLLHIFFVYMCVSLTWEVVFFIFPHGWEVVLVMLSAGLFHSRFIVVFLIVHAQEIRFCVVE